MSLRSKLSRLCIVDGAPSAPSCTADAVRAVALDDLRARMQATLERVASRPATPLPEVNAFDLPFATEVTSRGPLHVRMQRLSAAHRTGRASVSAAREACPELLSLLALDPSISECDPSRALYLDTETTGLSGGTGTVAFLVGLGWWEGATFVLEQILVRALGEEAPMLERVAERVGRAALLVTFNGKSFDMPLLRTRFVMARVAPPAEPPHLDLLHVARRVHRRRVKQGCRLVAIEREVLGFERIDDIESGNVAACYLHFLRTGNAQALHGVIEHNAWDVVAMAALVGLYGEPLQAELAASDLVGVAQTQRRAGALDRAAATADTAFAREPSPDSLRARADVAKARGDRARALAHFEALATSVDDASVRLELAKLYEHWVKEPDRAIEWVAQGTGESPAQVQKRAERLAKKAARVRQVSLGLTPTRSIK
ncbi:MAG: ribonuclease H-like domain-containing protein [Myxococcota bacterium]|nr:ribonuclease H-like domain-containing protein [Myxococcota bacterium]